MQDSKAPSPIDAPAFQDAVDRYPDFACVMHRGPFADCAGAVSPILAGSSSPWHWTSLDLETAPDIAAMFGIAGEAPWLLVMRDKVVLYREPLSARDAPEVCALLARAAGLDMAAVHEAVAQERLARDSLHTRRVCPTVLRGTG